MGQVPVIGQCCPFHPMTGCCFRLSIHSSTDQPVTASLHVLIHTIAALFPVGEISDQPLISPSPQSSQGLLGPYARQVLAKLPQDRDADR